MTQSALVNIKTLRHAWEVPDGLDRSLVHHNIPARQENGAVSAESSFGDGVLELRHVDMGARHRNGGTNVVVPGIEVSKGLADHRPEWIERHDCFRLAPAGVWSNRLNRGGVGEVWTMIALQGATGDRQGTIDGIGARMRTDGIALAHVRKGGDDRATLSRITVPPYNGARAGPKCAWMRRQDNVLLALLLVRCHNVLPTD